VQHCQIKPHFRVAKKAETKEGADCGGGGGGV
jgi:hypothetical protein